MTVNSLQATAAKYPFAELIKTLICCALSFIGVLGTDPVAVTTVDLSGVDFTPIVTAINSAVHAVLTAIIPITGTRKVISFIMGAVKGA